MGKLLGIDYGTKRIGVAISDESQTLAREIGIWPADTFFTESRQFLMDNPDIDFIVVGLPLAMSGTDSQKTEEARNFAVRLENELGKGVVLVDERLTSVMARNLPGGTQNVDSLAAQIILQSYLDKQKLQNNTNE